MTLSGRNNDLLALSITTLLLCSHHCTSGMLNGHFQGKPIEKHKLWGISFVSNTFFSSFSMLLIMFG